LASCQVYGIAEGGFYANLVESAGLTVLQVKRERERERGGGSRGCGEVWGRGLPHGSLLASVRMVGWRAGSV
jgi:hypothetical protein